jgi:hypothetical protein
VKENTMERQLQINVKKHSKWSIKRMRRVTIKLISLVIQYIAH